MKKLFVFLLLCFPAVVFSQEIKANVVDPFTNERTIETTLVSMKQGLTTGFGISFSATDNSYYMNVVGYGKESTMIKPGDKIWFVLNDGNVIQFNNRIEVYEEQSNKNIYLYHYYMKQNDLEILKNKQVAIIRIASGENRTDIKLSKKISKSLARLSEVFFNEVNKI